MKNTDTIDTLRMKDIIAQLSDVIFLLCNAKEMDTFVIINQLTNITISEQKFLHINLSNNLPAKNQ